MTNPSWLPLAEFMSASGMSRSNVFLHKRLDKIKTRKEGRTLLISTASLPAAAAPKTEPVKASTPAAAQPLTHPAVSSGKRIHLEPQAETAALSRLAMLQPLLDYCANKDGARHSALILGARNADQLADHLAKQHSTEDAPLSRATLWRWKRRYEEQGIIGLARKQRDDKGRSKWAERFPEAAQLAAATFLQPHSTRQRAYDALVRDRARLGISEAELPTYKAICDYLTTLPAPAVVWAREGERAHHERMANYLSRKYTDMQPNEIWVADTMLFDALVRNDYFGAQDNKAVRLQLTALMDMRSRKIVGYSFCLDGSSRSITSALIAAVKRYGPCATFYCDNGKDFKKVGRFAQPANGNVLMEDEVRAIERTGALAQLGIAVQFCIKYHPQSKPIERFFRTLHLRFDAEYPHYTTGNAYTKPDITVAAAAAHGKLLQMGIPESSPLLPASQFIRMASLWIEGSYNAEHKHGGRGMDDRTPDEVFAPALDARRPFDPSILDQLLWQRESRRVRNCAVTVQNRRLIGASEYAAHQLYLRNEQDVLVCFDPNAPECGVVTDLDGNKLCDVRAEEFAPHSAAAAPMIAASLQANRSRRNDTAASVRALRKTVAASGHRTAIQILSAQAMLPAAAGDNATQPVMQHSPLAPTKHVHSEDIGDELAARLARRACGA